MSKSRQNLPGHRATNKMTAERPLGHQAESADGAPAWRPKLS
jgi:hypothetical protein